MLESLGSLTGSPWIYGAVALSVLLDVFLPVLPSGVLVITAATAATAATAGSRVTTGHTPHRVPDVLFLILSAATASVLGDMVAYGLARRGGERLARTIGRSGRLATAQERLGSALSRGGGALVVLARFAPAGRSVVSLGAGAAGRRVREFLPWSALAGLAWAGYSVGLGYFGGQWLGTTWIATAVSVLALFAAGAGAGYVMRRPEEGMATGGAAPTGKPVPAEGTAPTEGSGAAEPAVSAAAPVAAKERAAPAVAGTGAAPAGAARAAGAAGAVEGFAAAGAAPVGPAVAGHALAGAAAAAGGSAVAPAPGAAVSSALAEATGHATTAVPAGGPVPAVPAVSPRPS